MIGIVAIYLLCMPLGYLAGDVYLSKKPNTIDGFPLICMILLPLASVVAITLLLETSE